MRQDNIQNYYKIVKHADLIGRFDYLINVLMVFPTKFTSEMAKELLDIIDNNQEDLMEIAQAFRDSGEKVENILNYEWDHLRKIVEKFL